MDLFYLIFQQALMLAIPLTMVALGGMFSERSGTINIALEGIMIVGAFSGTVIIKIVQEANPNFPAQLLFLIAMLVAGIIGMIYSSLLAVSSITLKADQTIGGTALNIIAPALVIYVARMAFNTRNINITQNFFLADGVPFLSKIPVIGDLFFKNTYVSIYVGFAVLAIAAFVLYKTRFGLRLRSCGEHPQAADSVGINVYKTRYIGVLISGLLGGMGGIMYSIPTVGSFGGNVGGYGFLALAVMIFGQWKPLRIFVSALFFAVLGALSSFYISIPFLVNLGIPKEVFKMLPYFATLVVLAFTSKKSRAPKAEGIPYDKALR